MNKRRYRVFGSAVLPVLAAVGATSPARAADEPAADAGGLEEIVVTAQKRPESLQTVPLALSALTGATLESRHIDTLDDLSQEIPSLVSYSNSAGTPQYYIRGMGNNVRGGAFDGDVGVFLNGVYLSNPVMYNLDYTDLDEVEVLRGPQGTLFGRNVVGGAVSYRYREPTEETRMGAEATVGNYDELDGKFFASGPVADKLYAGIALSTRNHSGYDFNTTTGQHVEDESFTAGHATLRYVPTDDLDIQLMGDMSRRTGDGGWEILYNAGKEPTAHSELSDPRVANQFSDDGYLNYENDGFTLQTNWKLPFGTLTSITAYRKAWREYRNISTPPDVPAVFPGPVVGQESNILYNQFGRENTSQESQEIRLASATNQRFKWVVGLYYFHDKDDYNPSIQYEFFNYKEAGTYGTEQWSATTSYATFLNASYDILDDLTAQAGVRGSHDEKDAQTLAYGPNFTPWTTDGVKTPAGYDVYGSGSWNAVTPTFSLNYRLLSDKFLYATVSKGYKSGAFYAPLEDAVAARTPVNPEYVWNYEFGAKTEWLDRRLRANVSAFYDDYSQLQVNAIETLPSGLGTHVLLNAGKTVSKGVESEFTAAVTRQLLLYASYTYLWTDIEQTDAAAGATLHVGDQLPYSPHNKLNVGAAYTADLGSALVATARLDYSYMSGYFSTLPDDPLGFNTPLKRVDGGLLFDFPQSRWSLEFWGKNLTNQVRAYVITPITGFGYYGALDPPRTYGFTIRYKGN